MDDELYKFMENKTKSNVLRTTIFVILSLVIIDQLYSLSKFVSLYTKNFDYGRMLKGACYDGYTEYETGRFHIMQNVAGMRLKNDNYFDRYNVLIFVVALICILYVAYFFVFVFIESSFSSILKQILSSTIPNIQTLTSSTFDSLYSMKTFDIIIAIIKTLLITYLIIIIPLFVVLKVGAKVDISPFVSDIKNILPHTVILTAILFFQFFTKNTSYFTFNVFFALFVVSFFLMYLITDIYIQEQGNSRNNNLYENSDNKGLQHLTFVKSYSNDLNNTDRNVFVSFLMNVFGLNDIKINLNESSTPGRALSEYEQMAFDFNQSFSSVKVNDFKNIVFVLLVLLACLFFVYIMLYFFKPDSFSLYGIFHADHLDRDLLYSFAFIPLLLVMITLLVIVATKEYNTFVNRHIFYNPNNLYRRKLKKINDVFNAVIENDKATVVNSSVCRNVANAIHMVIYSSLFLGYSKIFVPELRYDSKCLERDYIDYTKMKEYSIDYYTNKHNLFYENAKCSSVDNELLIIVMKNTLAFHAQSRSAIIEMLKFCINNVLNKKTYDATKRLEIADEYVNNNQIRRIAPKLEDQQFIDEDIIQLVEETADELIEFLIVMHNSNIRVIQALCKCNSIADITLGGNKTIVNGLDAVVNDQSNGEYSLGIKKYYINRFTILSKIMQSNINTRLSAKTKITEHNLKVAKHIIKNYNVYQEHQSDKFKKRSLDAVDTRSYIDSSVSKYSDIKDIQDIIEMIKASFEAIDDYYKGTSGEESEEGDAGVVGASNAQYDRKEETGILSNINVSYGKAERYLNETKVINENDVEEIVLSIDKNIAELRKRRNDYRDVFKGQFYLDDDYNKQLVFDYKMQYIDEMAQLNEKAISDVRSASADTIVKRLRFKRIDLFQYTKKYEEIQELYSTRCDTLMGISNDLFKNDPANTKELTNEDETSLQVARNARDTSASVYILLVIYLVLIAVANRIR